jgi:hypothetical protein
VIRYADGVVLACKGKVLHLLSEHPLPDDMDRALFSKFTQSPIFLSGIVVSKDPASMTHAGQEAAMQRAITNRIALSFPAAAPAVTNTNEEIESPQSSLHPSLPQISFTSLQYESGKCAMETYHHRYSSSHSVSVSQPTTLTLPQESIKPMCSSSSPILSKRKRKALALLEQNPCSELKSCSTNINWIRDLRSSPSSSSVSGGGKETKRGKGHCLNGTIEITLANTGRPQGTTKAAASSGAGHTMESRLCRRYIPSRSFSDLTRRALGALCLELEGLVTMETSHSDAQQGEGKNGGVMYGEVKRRGNESYLQARQLFLSNESFRRWAVDDPEASEMFLLTNSSYPYSLGVAESSSSQT